MGLGQIGRCGSSQPALLSREDGNVVAPGWRRHIDVFAARWEREEALGKDAADAQGPRARDGLRRRELPKVCGGEYSLCGVGWARFESKEKG